MRTISNMTTISARTTSPTDRVRPASGEEHPSPTLAHPRRQALALVVLATAQLMVMLDLTIVNIALPAMQRALTFSPTSLAWVVDGYVLAFGGFLLLGGSST